MRKNKENIRNLVSIVNYTANQLHAKIWGSHRKLRVDLIKIVINNF